MLLNKSDLQDAQSACENTRIYIGYRPLDLYTSKLALVVHTQCSLCVTKKFVLRIHAILIPLHGAI